MKGRRHSLKVRLRAFHIWQVLGYSPWKSEWTVADDAPEGNVKGFYRGAFDSIPFLNDDAVSADTVSSLYSEPKLRISLSDEESVRYAELEDKLQVKLDNVEDYANIIDILMHLDKHPEAIDSPKKASLAAFESAVRSQGINYFLGLFLVLWPCMRIVLRKHSMGWAASATATAYVLCQFSFFMLFVLILSLGKSNEIGTLFMGLLIMIDYRQLLGVNYAKSIWLTLKTALWFALMIFLLIAVLSAILLVYMFV